MVSVMQEVALPPIFDVMETAVPRATVLPPVFVTSIAVHVPQLLFSLDSVMVPDPADEFLSAHSLT